MHILNSKKSIFLCFIFLTVWQAAASAAITTNEDKVVAVVGEKKISLKDFNRKFEEVKRQTVNPPPKDLFLEDLIRYEMGVQEARRKGMEKDPIVQERIQQEMYKGLIERELGEDINNIKISDAEMKAYYSKNPEIRYSDILIEFKPDATPEQREIAKKRAKEIYEEVKKSKRSFEELVTLYSDDTLSKKTGGDVGWQTSMTLSSPEFYQALLKVKKGQIHGVLETPFGYHIVKVTDRHAFEDANHRQIRAAVFEEKRKQKFDNFFAKLKKNYKVEKYKDVLSKN